MSLIFWIRTPVCLKQNLTNLIYLMKRVLKRDFATSLKTSVGWRMNMLDLNISSCFSTHLWRSYFGGFQGVKLRRTRPPKRLLRSCCFVGFCRFCLPRTSGARKEATVFQHLTARTLEFWANWVMLSFDDTNLFAELVDAFLGACLLFGIFFGSQKAITHSIIESIRFRMLWVCFPRAYFCLDLYSRLLDQAFWFPSRMTSGDWVVAKFLLAFESTGNCHGRLDIMIHMCHIRAPSRSPGACLRKQSLAGFSLASSWSSGYFGLIGMVESRFGFIRIPVGPFSLNRSPRQN